MSLIARHDPLKNGTLKLPGAHQLTLTGVHWAGIPSDEEFAQVDALRQTLGRVDAWLEGDVVCEFVRREQHKRPRASVRELTWEYAKGHNSTPDTAYDRYCVASTFPHKHRVQGLPWSHHRIVWACGVKPLHKALAWLARAQENNWTPEELRRHLRDTKAPALSTEPQLQSFFPPELRAAEDWSSGQLHCVDEITVYEATQLLESMPCTTQFIDALRAKTAQSVIS
jgi:hypothetical protein